MTQTIQVSDETYARLMALVNPLFNVDAVISALLNHAPGAPRPNQTSVHSTVVDTPTTTVGTLTTVSAPLNPAPESTRVIRPPQGGPTPVRRTVISRAKRGDSTDRRVYMRHILAELARAGGSSTVDEIRRNLELRLVPSLKPTDLDSLPNKPNELRWWNHTRFARQRLVDQHLLRDDSQYGTWTLTDAGWRVARPLLHNVNDPKVEID